MNITEAVRSLRVDNLNVEVYESTEAMGRAAANAAAARMCALADQHETVAVIFATGSSQASTLEALTAIPGLPWDKVVGFHLDEYSGLSEQHPASFRHYLWERLTHKVKMRYFYEIDGNTRNIEDTCRKYSALLHQYKPQLCLLGIGENGHLAFNDPSEADFRDPADIKIVSLDEECRQQQVNEQWFTHLAEVPIQALTLTIPTLMRVPQLIASVPGKRKAHVVRRTLIEEVSTRCPSTILRTHPNTTMYLDPESAIDLP